MKNKFIGQEIYNLCKKLFPYHRSLTGSGNRKTLNILKKICSKLKIIEIPSRKSFFDWNVPDEWNVIDAWIKDKKNKKIVDYKKNNLHIIGYSEKINKKISLKQLKNKLHFLKKIPRAIPYVTSYYNKDWGFCIPYNLMKKLKNGIYKVYINSNFKKGHLSYGEIILPGKEKKEVFISTYICHPSLANDNLSGICLSIFLAKWLMLRERRYTYRIIFIPETIGSIIYLKKNFKIMKKNLIAGFNISCVGDDKNISFLPTREGDSFVDRIALHVLKWKSKKFLKYTWLFRGGDERQYCAPNINLPVCSIMRTKYGEYKEYHTSLDNLNFINPKGLNESYEIYKTAIEAIENNCIPISNHRGEPFLTKYKLIPTLSKANTITHSQKALKKDLNNKVYNMLNLVSYSDGKNTLLDIADKCKLPIWKLYPLLKILKQKKIIRIVKK